MKELYVKKYTEFPTIRTLVASKINPWFPQKDEIWELSIKGQTITRNILAINNEHFKVAIWGRYPTTKEYRIDDVEFIRRVG